MKLYFYILERSYSEKPFVRFEQGEVIEKPKTYYPVDNFPSGIYTRCINKSDIGHLSGCSDNLVVLTEPNTKLAKEIFTKQYESKVRQYEKFLAKAKAELNAILEMEELK